MSHYTQEKEKRTEAVLERVLAILVDSAEPIVLEGKEFKKINFSNIQVTAALAHFATPQEHLDGAVFKDSSTISKNTRYQILITEAKIKRTEKEIGDTNLSFNGNKKLTEMEQKIMLDRLLYEKEMLAEKNRCLEDIIRQADLEAFLQEENPVTNKPLSVDKTIIGLLEKILILGSRDSLVAIEKAEKGKSAQVLYFGLNGEEFLCFANDLESLNISFDTDKNGRIILKEKGLINGQLH